MGATIRTGAARREKAKGKTANSERRLTTQVESPSEGAATSRDGTDEMRLVPPPARACSLCGGRGDLLFLDLENGWKTTGDAANWGRSKSTRSRSAWPCTAAHCGRSRRR